jgi:serine/alanine adding enzyme
VSMPFQDYGGICSQDELASELLLQKSQQLRDQCGAKCLELRQRDVILPGEGVLRQDKATLILNISAGSEIYWKGLSGKVRNQVRKAEKAGLRTHLGGAELLEEFYPVFSANMRDLGSPVHHFRFFAQVFRTFGENARLLVVRDGYRAIGGLICLFFKDNIVVPWASSLREYFSKCPNNLLYWNAIQLGCDRGCRSFDFGRSSIGSGTYKFKLQWGAIPIPLHWKLFPKKEGIVFSSLSDDSKYRIAANIWKKLPLSLTTILGPYLRKYISN